MFFLIQIIIELYMIRYIIIKIGKFFRNEKFFNKNNYLILVQLVGTKKIVNILLTIFSVLIIIILKN